MVNFQDLSILEQKLQSADESERWSAAADLGEYVYERPDLIWPLVLRFGSSEDEDLRTAIATNVLEHVLQHHFDKFFPILESEIRKGNENLKSTLRRCSKFGQSKEPSRSKRWDSLIGRRA